ncbi:restriction endonuclease subunit S [Actinomadura sp. KC06]|uniref:restriction endonuclease subunit S n=1 Tax=Actinomadura sp. KC06 TaxID=2530369 RepID=UPI001044BDE5|nr:restriction endonuclease subunit S [Actinomadura sp. KC06]TDD29361.1 restriction endonuclease subunit S [Actinomadura sp. KC06]
MSDGHVRLGELVTFSNGKSHATGQGTAYETYGANGVIGASDRFNAEAHATIVGRVGSYCGAVHYSRDRCWVTDNAIIATAKDGVNPRYVYYLLKRLDLNRYRIGSGQPLLTQGILSRLAVARMTRAEQDSAASVLTALDDKIAANGRIAATADELVRARYEELAAAATATIRIERLGSLVRANIPPERIPRDANYIALEHMPKRHMWLTSWTDSSNVISAKRRFAPGDVLFGKLRPYFHKAGLAFVGGIASTDILIVRPKQDVHRGWLLAALSSDDVVAHASAVGDGTRMPRAKWPDLAAHEVPWPDAHARGFNEFVKPLARRVEAAAAENRTLACLRDTLLPRLIP